MTNAEINEAVARKLGYYGRIDFTSEHPMYPIPDYCGSIQAAWEIVEHCFDKGLIPCVNYLERLHQWHCNLHKRPYGLEDDDGYADTAPLAICLAFLKLEAPPPPIQPGFYQCWCGRSYPHTCTWC